MTTFRILPGLPPYGPRAISFPDPDAFREGLVIEFAPDASASWIGNFVSSSSYLPNAVFLELGSDMAVVIAGGAGYLVNCQTRQLVRQLGQFIEHCWYQPNITAMIVVNGTDFEAFDAVRTLWKVDTVMLDGVTIDDRSGAIVTGELFDPLDETWHPFTLNTLDGALESQAISRKIAPIYQASPVTGIAAWWQKLRKAVVR